MANVFIHGRSPANQQLSLRCDDTGILLSTTDIAGENGEKLIINQLPLETPPTIAGSLNALNFGLDTVNNEYHPISIDENGLLNVNVISGGGGGGGGTVQIQDSNGNPLLGNNNALDVNIKSVDLITVGTETGLATNIINDKLNTNIYAFDFVGNQDVKINAEVNNLTNTNRLYTHSNIYANNDTNVETPIKCDIDGNLNVNVVSGGGGTVFIQDSLGGQLLGTDSALNVNVKGVNLVNVGGVVGLSTNINNSSLSVDLNDGVGNAISSTVQGTSGNFLNTYSRMVGTSNGTDFKVALTDSGGRLATTSRITDSSGNSVGSQIQTGGTQRGLNVVDINQTYTGTNLNVNVSNTATTNSNTYGFDTNTSSFVVVNATNNRLLTNSLTSGTGTISGASIGIGAVENDQFLGINALITHSNLFGYHGSGGGLVNTPIQTDNQGNLITVGSPSIEGTYNNIHSGNLTASTFSTALNIDNNYGNESVISYQDTAIALTSFISIYGSLDGTNYFYIGVLQPALIRATLRQASSVLKLKGLKWIKIYNEDTTTTATDVSATLFSGENK